MESNAIYEVYQAIKNEKNADNDTLKNAIKAIINCYPDIESNNENAWKALKDKDIIKQFYIDYIVAEYSKEKSLELDKAQIEVEKAMHELFNNIKGNPNEGGTKLFDNFLQEIKDYNTKNDFQCDLLTPFIHKDGVKHCVNFPYSTLSFIAGRPSAGKTTALSSIAMYAMRKTSKKVLFITSEESSIQLVLRFIKNQFCNNCIENGLGNLLSQNDEDYINNTFKDILIKHNTQNELFELDNIQDAFTKQVLKSANEVRTYINNGRLQVFNLDKTTSFDELKDVLQEQSRHTIVILDYMQNLPYAPKTTIDGTPISINDRLEQLRTSIYEFNRIIKMNELIGIAGAQFNRVGADEHKPESLELNKLGDSGEIERKAHIVIGLGRRINDDNKVTFFYRVMKDREGKISKHFVVEDFYQYSYLRSKLDNDNNLIDFKPDTTQTKRTKATKEGAGNKPATTEPVIRKGEPMLI